MNFLRITITISIESIEYQLSLNIYARMRNELSEFEKCSNSKHVYQNILLIHNIEIKISFYIMIFNAQLESLELKL